MAGRLLLFWLNAVAVWSVSRLGQQPTLANDRYLEVKRDGKNEFERTCRTTLLPQKKAFILFSYRQHDQ